MTREENGYTHKQWLEMQDVFHLQEQLADAQATIAALTDACKWAEVQFQTLADSASDSPSRLYDDPDLLSGGVTHRLRAVLTPDLVAQAA